MSIPGIRFITSNTPGSGNAVGIGLSAVRGPTGPAGAFGGPQGNLGVQGTQGYQGLIGLQGLIGATGAPGTIGINGVQGATGSQGLQGLLGPTGSNPIIDPNYKTLVVPDFKGVNVSQLIPTLVGAIKKQGQIITQLQNELSLIKAHLGM